MKELKTKENQRSTRVLQENGSPRCPELSKPRSRTHEIRTLRAQVASMEEELGLLQAKWRKQLKDDRTLAIAHNSAREKHAASQAEKAQEDLQRLLQQQQLLFATLQTAVARAPFHSTGKDMFDLLHFGTCLGSDPVERERRLLEHHERSTATLPSIVDMFSPMAIHTISGTQENEDNASTPLSRIDISGGQDYTLVSSVFITEIPSSSLEQVYAAVLAYFDDIPRYMKWHFNVNAQRTRLNHANSPVLYRRSTFDGSKVSTTVNNIVCSELTASCGMVHIDAVTDDSLYPVTESESSQYSICGLTISPRKEPLTGRTLSVTLRWLVVYCYNTLPCDPVIKEDLRVIRPILNGDLITASVCSFIQDNSQN